MKGTAVVTTTTTQRPVYVTTIKKGTVTYQTARSIQIKEPNGVVHKFTQSEIDKRGIQLYMGDTPIRVSQLNPGDKIRGNRDRGQAGNPHGQGSECAARS